MLGDGYEQLTPFTRTIDKIKVKHHECGNTYETTPKSIRKGSKCNYCYGNMRKTTSQFREEVELKSLGEYKLVQGETYKNNKTPLKVQHLVECGHVYKVTPKDFLRGNRCPLCKESKGERLVRHFLIKMDVEFEREKRYEDLRSSGSYMPFDYYLPDHNLLIEYDGEQHYKPTGYFGGEEKLKSQQRRDNKKNKYAKENGIKLLRIPYYYSDEEVFKAIKENL